MRKNSLKNYQTSLPVFHYKIPNATISKYFRRAQIRYKYHKDGKKRS